MEPYDQMIKDTRRWLGEVDKFASEVTQQQLARLETLERVLRYIILRNETDTHSKTYESVCITFLGNIVLNTGTALISKATDDMSQGKSHFPEILKPKHEEVKGYLRKLEGKIGEIDLVINEIDQELKRRNYKLTEEEKLKVEMLLMDVDAKSQQAKIYFEAGDKTLKSLYSDLESYLSAKRWKAFGWGAAGALGVAIFSPVLLSVMPGAGGGGVLASGARILYGEDTLNPALRFEAGVGLAASGLCLQLKRWYDTRNFCNGLCSIIQNYSVKVDEMKRSLNFDQNYQEL